MISEKWNNVQGKVIALHGVPRSGTSWLGQIFNSSPRVAFRYQPLFSYTFKEDITENSSAEEILEFYVKLHGTTDHFVLQKDPAIHYRYPTFKKVEPSEFLVFKHVRYHYILQTLLEQTTTKVVMLIRHPCAVINSWFKAPREFDSSWDMNTEWQFAQSKNRGRREEYYGYIKWKETTELFLDLHSKFSDRTYLLKYPDLIADPEKEVYKLFEFCQIPFEEQTAAFITTSTSESVDDTYGVYKIRKKDHEWKKELPFNIQQAILRDLESVNLYI